MLQSLLASRVILKLHARLNTANANHQSRCVFSHHRHMVGTLEYMAPEVLLKQPGSFASDVYAFAVAVNELASGVMPFSDCTRENPKAHTILDMGYGRSARALVSACWLSDMASHAGDACLLAVLTVLQSYSQYSSRHTPPRAGLT